MKNQIIQLIGLYTLLSLFFGCSNTEKPTLYEKEYKVLSVVYQDITKDAPFSGYPPPTPPPPPKDTNAITVEEAARFEQYNKEWEDFKIRQKEKHWTILIPTEINRHQITSSDSIKYSFLDSLDLSCIQHDGTYHLEAVQLKRGLLERLRNDSMAVVIIHFISIQFHRSKEEAIVEVGITKGGLSLKHNSVYENIIHPYLANRAARLCPKGLSTHRPG